MFPDVDEAGLPTFLLVTCEHAGREVPEPYRQLFAGADDVLEGHRGYDHGALGVALRLGAKCSAPLIFTTTTRLLVECNRPLHHPALFSEFTAALSDAEKRRIVAAYHEPHCRSVERAVASAIQAGMRVLHVGVHSFTDVLDGQVRDVDVGVLFDPSRPDETAISEAWIAELGRQRGDYRIRANEPYAGIDECLVSTLREKFSADRYLGVEIEVRQGLVPTEEQQHAMGDLLAATLARVVGFRSRSEG